MINFSNSSINDESLRKNNDEKCSKPVTHEIDYFSYATLSLKSVGPRNSLIYEVSPCLFINRNNVNIARSGMLEIRFGGINNFDTLLKDFPKRIKVAGIFPDRRFYSRKNEIYIEIQDDDFSHLVSFQCRNIGIYDPINLKNAINSQGRFHNKPV